MTAFRDFFRRRRVRRHVARNGWRFDFHGQTVAIPDLGDPGAASALLRGKYEAEEAELILKHLPPDRPVIEIGGSLGVVARLVRSRLAPGVRHIVVEANPALTEICRANATGSDPRATTVLVAALSYDGPTATFALGRNVHANRLAGASYGTADRQEDTITVPAVTLADLWGQVGGTDGYSLVCDIEGGELAMAQRDAAVLGRAGLVIMELHPHYYPEGDADAAGIGAAMTDMGFTLAGSLRDVRAWVRAAAG